MAPSMLCKPFLPIVRHYSTVLSVLETTASGGQWPSFHHCIHHQQSSSYHHHHHPILWCSRHQISRINNIRHHQTKLAAMHINNCNNKHV